MRSTAIASHRGGAMLWPENSPTAFRETAQLPVDFVEFDVHPSRDGVIVVHHDATLDRTTNGTGPISEQNWSELSQLKLRGTESDRPPVLAEVVEIFRSTPILLRLEIKAGVDHQPYPDFEQLVATELDALEVLDRTIVTSFLLGVLSHFRPITTLAGRIWLVNPMVLNAVGGLEQVIKLAKDAGIAEIGLRQEVITAAAVAACRDSQLRIGAYAAHDEAAMTRMLDLGVSVFTTDDPVSALRLRRNR